MTSLKVQPTIDLVSSKVREFIKILRDADKPFVWTIRSEWGNPMTLYIDIVLKVGLYIPDPEAIKISPTQYRFVYTGSEDVISKKIFDTYAKYEQYLSLDPLLPVYRLECPKELLQVASIGNFETFCKRLESPYVTMEFQ